jgi:hypothetical protein
MVETLRIVIAMDARVALGKINVVVRLDLPPSIRTSRSINGVMCGAVSFNLMLSGSAGRAPARGPAGGAAAGGRVRRTAVGAARGGGAGRRPGDPAPVALRGRLFRPAAAGDVRAAGLPPGGGRRQVHGPADAHGRRHGQARRARDLPQTGE